MCDSSYDYDDTDSSYIVLKDNADESACYVVKDLKCDTDENTLILEKEPCGNQRVILKENTEDSSCFFIYGLEVDTDENTIILEESTSFFIKSEDTCKNTCKNDNDSCCDDKYKAIDFGMKQFNYAKYIDNKCVCRLEQVKILLLQIKEVVKELINDIILLKSNIHSYDSKSMKCYLATYKSAIHRFIKNFQIVLSKKYGCKNYINNRLNIYKCECKKCLKGVKNAAFNNVNCMNDEKEIILIYSIPGFTIYLNTSTSYLYIVVDKCKYHSTSDVHNCNHFIILPELKVKNGKLSKKLFINSINSVYDYCNNDCIDLREFIEFLNINILEITSVVT